MDGGNASDQSVTTKHSATAIRESITDLISSYHELNATSIDELTEEPSPLEFMRYVHLNRPFVVRGGARDWSALRNWDAEYLKAKLDASPVNVACTPLGNADSVIELDEHLMFVKPHETIEPFGHAMALIQGQEISASDHVSSPIRYLQTQNDNLRGEYSTIFEDVPKDIPFARIALQKVPDAVNFWLGNSRSTTALHKDNYENVYVQVLGQKHFVLLPPAEAACINEQELPAATYTPNQSGVLKVELDEPPATVPFATWDPDEPLHRPTFASHLSQPTRVTLNPGDMFYLPAQWYHKVSQSCSPHDRVCVAVNYWYDMEFSGAFHNLTSFARDVSKLACL